SRFFHLLQQQNYPEHWLVGIIDRQRRFIARWPQDESQLGSLASDGWRAAIAASAEGYNEAPSLEGTLFVNAYTMTARGWTVGAAMSKSALDAPLWTTRRNLAIGAGFCLALSALFGWLLSRRLVRATERLERAATEMAQEEPLIPQTPIGVRE